MFSGDEPGRGSSGESRGQTTLDFAIGISIFLAVVMFIFLFVPGIVSPFTAGAQDETVTVNRVADGLTQGQLGSPDRPGVLRADCTVDFFDSADVTGNDITQCESPGNDLATFVGIKDRQNVNVSLHGNITAGDRKTEMLCWDVDDGVVEGDGDGAGDGACDHGTDDTLLTAGDTPPTNNADSVTAKRVASIDGEDVTVIVEMW